MKVRDLFRLLANEDLDAEVMVSVDMMLSRSDPRPGVLIVPTRCIEAGRFVDGSMAGQPWVSVIGTDAWGLSPGSTPKHDVVPSDNAAWAAKVIRSKGWCGRITVEGEPPREVGCILPAGHDDGVHDKAPVASEKAPKHEEWCVICKREPRDHTDAEYRACMAACGLAPVSRSSEAQGEQPGGGDQAEGRVWNGCGCVCRECLRYAQNTHTVCIYSCALRTRTTAAPMPCKADSEWGCDARKKLGIARGALIEAANMVTDAPTFDGDEEIIAMLDEAVKETGQPQPCAPSGPSSCPVPMVGRAWDCSQCKRRIWDNEQDHHVTPWACPYGCGSTSRLVRATPFTRAAKKAEHG